MFVHVSGNHIQPEYQSTTHRRIDGAAPGVQPTTGRSTVVEPTYSHSIVEGGFDEMS